MKIEEWLVFIERGSETNEKYNQFFQPVKKVQSFLFRNLKKSTINLVEGLIEIFIIVKFILHEKS